MSFAFLLLLAVDVAGHVTGHDSKTDIVAHAPGFLDKGKQFEPRLVRPDAKGNFAFKGLPKEFSIIEAVSWHGEKLNYAWVEWKGQPQVELAMTAVKPIKGKVVMAGAGPIPKGLLVTCPGDVTSKVGADGSFDLGILNPNWYEIELEHLPPGATYTIAVGKTAVPAREVDLRRLTGDLLLTIKK